MIPGLGHAGILSLLCSILSFAHGYLLYQKEALFNSAGKQKVKDILDRLHLNGRDYADSRFALETVLSERMNYLSITAVLEEWRQESRAFLGGVLQ